MSAPFIDTLDPGCDADHRAAGRTARGKSWSARSPLRGPEPLPIHFECHD